MMERKQEITERLQREFEVCDKHKHRIREALSDLGIELPISEEKYVNLAGEQVRCIDQFVFRFSKMQDAIGSKIFRYLLELLDEDVNTLPMRDILNRLERFRIVPSADDWIYMRELKTR